MDVQGRQLHDDDHLHAQLALVVRLAVMSLVTLAPAAARAQVSVEVNPPRIELKAQAPGGTATQAITLTNHDSHPVRIHVGVDDWYLSKDGTPQFKPAAGTMPYSAASWVRVNPVEQVVQPHGSFTVRCTTAAPAGTAPGGYRAAVMFTLAPPEGPLVRKGVVIQGRVVTLIYLTIGSPKPAIDLTDVQPRLVPGQPPVVVATLKNTGRVHVRTRGHMIVYDKKGTVVRRLLIPDVPVLPESERDLAVSTVDEKLPPLGPGEYRIEMRIDVGMPELLVGETTLIVG